MLTSDFDYTLPPELIAQCPLAERSQARMMVVARNRGVLAHRRVADLPDYLSAGDVLVLNDTRVIPARLRGVREDSGGRVELLLVEDLGDGCWEALARASGRLRSGVALSLAGGRLRGTVVSGPERGRWRIDFQGQGVLDVLEEHGETPLPPYIRRPHATASTALMDRARYQTVYARHPGAVAAPTAGLHLTEDLLKRLRQGGVRTAAVTLHVGPGTFRPVRGETIEEHVMDSERVIVSESTAELLRAARREGGRIVAVGTTTVRALETVFLERGDFAPYAGRTDLFIRPPFRFGVVDALLTNFHLPRSTLLMLVCAFAGRETTLRAYEEAVRERYRFYSYGDCMLAL